MPPFTSTGLGRYKAPTLPVDLNQGYPDKYHPKDINKGSPVETVIEAVLHAEGEHGPLLQGAHVSTAVRDLYCTHVESRHAVLAQVIQRYAAHFAFRTCVVFRPCVVFRLIQAQ